MEKSLFYEEISKWNQKDKYRRLSLSYLTLEYWSRKSYPLYNVQKVIAWTIELLYLRKRRNNVQSDSEVTRYSHSYYGEAENDWY